MTTTSDESALLRAIAAHTAEDLPRLMYADWLEENGQPERAEFIRLQIWISQQQHPHDVCPGCGYEPADGYHHNSPDCPYVRVEDLFTAHGGSWSNAIVDRVNPQTQTSTVHIGGVNIRIAFARGFAETLYMPTLADLCEQKRRGCVYCGWRGERWVSRLAPLQSGQVGLVGEYISCEDCEIDYTGKPTQLALDIMRAHPTITRVVVGDRRPWGVAHGAGDGLYYWSCNLTPESFSHGQISKFIWDEIPHDDSMLFATEQSALDALAVAAGQWLRSHTQGEPQ